MNLTVNIIIIVALTRCQAVSKVLSYIISFNHKNTPMSLVPFYDEETDIKRLNGFLKNIRLRSGIEKVQMWTQS